MFYDSYLRACMKLWIVQKLDFPFLSLGGPSHGAQAETPNPGTIAWSAQTQEGKI